MRVRGDQFRVGRVLHEDDAFMTIEVAKDQSRELRLQEGDRFLTLMFVRKGSSSSRHAEVQAWVPWE